MTEIGIESSLLGDILAGKKTIEPRLGKPKYLKLRVGDTLSLREDIFQNNEIVQSNPDQATITITQILYFETFEDMLHAIDYRAAIPSATSTQDALETYYRIYPNAEEEDEYCVVAFTFSLS